MTTKLVLAADLTLISKDDIEIKSFAISYEDGSGSIKSITYSVMEIGELVIRERYPTEEVESTESRY